MVSIPSQFDHDAALLACAQGDRGALHRLYAEEGAHLLGVVARIVRDRALAEDIVHDVFIRVWARAHQFDPQRGAGRGWLFSVARNLALNAMRDRARDVQLDDQALAALDAEAALEQWQGTRDAFDWQLDAGRIEHCLGHLEPVRRNCVLHAYLDGLSHGDIAAKVGAPLGTVKAWIKRSLANLRECLS